uniref:hypothetical protein n=1 Tax=Nonomuraea pusilla TaxID=46177 RepID=UPI000B2A8F55|nr:hypothetical protein [Nonomuraea pusilla]
MDELRLRAGAGNGSAARRLADLLTEQAREDETITVLHVPADAGDRPAAEQLADLLTKQERVDELRIRVEAGDRTPQTGCPML